MRASSMATARGQTTVETCAGRRSSRSSARMAKSAGVIAHDRELWSQCRHLVVPHGHIKGEAVDEYDRLPCPALS